MNFVLEVGELVTLCYQMHLNFLKIPLLNEHSIVLKTKFVQVACNWACAKKKSGFVWNYLLLEMESLPTRKVLDILKVF